MRHALWLGLVGCGERWIDEGAACVPEAVPFFADTGATTSIVAGEPSTVTVVFSACSSGSVDWRRPSCEATVDGTTLTVTSRVIHEAPLFGMTMDCQFVTTTCPTPVLDAGEWTLVYGDEAADFTVPWDGPPVCAGEG